MIRFIIASLILLGICVLPAYAATSTLTPATLELNKKLQTITLSIDPLQESIIEYKLYLTYDPTIMQVTDIKNTGTSFAPITPPIIDNNAGILKLHAATTSPESAEFIPATFTISGLSRGNTEFSIGQNSRLTTDAGQSIFLDPVSASVTSTITQTRITSAPTPTTIPSPTQFAKASSTVYETEESITASTATDDSPNNTINPIMLSSIALASLLTASALIGFQIAHSFNTQAIRPKRTQRYFKHTT